MLIQAEHDKIRENKPADEKLTWEEYKSMTFTQHVITESVRMSTPLNLLMREAKEDVKIYSKHLSLHKPNLYQSSTHGNKLMLFLYHNTITHKDLSDEIEILNLFACWRADYIVPKKWKVFTSLMSVHYDPVGFKEPLKFNPYRYMVRLYPNS